MAEKGHVNLRVWAASSAVSCCAVLRDLPPCEGWHEPRVHGPDCRSVEYIMAPIHRVSIGTPGLMRPYSHTPARNASQGRGSAKTQPGRTAGQQDMAQHLHTAAPPCTPPSGAHASPYTRVQSSQCTLSHALTCRTVHDTVYVHAHMTPTNAQPSTDCVDRRKISPSWRSMPRAGLPHGGLPPTAALGFIGRVAASPRKHG